MLLERTHIVATEPYVAEVMLQAHLLPVLHQAAAVVRNGPETPAGSLIKAATGQLGYIRNLQWRQLCQQSRHGSSPAPNAWTVVSSYGEMPRVSA